MSQKKIAAALSVLAYDLDGDRAVLEDKLVAALREIAGAAARQVRRKALPPDPPTPAASEARA